MKVIALDFETANEQRASPCSSGLAWIKDGHLGVDFAHHDAAADAYACGRGALAATSLNGLAHVRELPGSLGMTVGRLDHDGYTPPRGAVSVRRTRVFS